MANFKTKVHKELGGAQLTAENGGSVVVKSGGTLDVQSGSTLKIAGVQQVGYKKIVQLALAGGVDTGGGIGVWQNPEAGPIWIERCVVSSEGTGGAVATGACNLDAGTTAVNAATLSDTLIDGLDIHTALITGDNFTAAGSNGKSGKSLASGKWVTFSMADAGASAGFVGEAFIEYTVL